MFYFITKQTRDKTRFSKTSRRLLKRAGSGPGWGGVWGGRPPGNWSGVGGSGAAWARPAGRALCGAPGAEPGKPRPAVTCDRWSGRRPALGHVRGGRWAGAGPEPGSEPGPLCPEHGQALNWFCCSERRLVCAACTGLGGRCRGHRILRAEKRAEELRNKIVGQCERLKIN